MQNKSVTRLIYDRLRNITTKQYTVITYVFAMLGSNVQQN